MFFFMNWRPYYFILAFVGIIVCRPICVSRVVGRTAFFLDGWAQLTQDPWVLMTVSLGYKLDFTINPLFQRHAPPNAKMDALKSSLWDEEVNALINKGVGVEVGKEAGYISHHFWVPKKGPNEWRRIINLKPLNQFLKYKHFKMEGIVTRRGHSLNRALELRSNCARFLCSFLFALKNLPLFPHPFTCKKGKHEHNSSAGLSECPDLIVTVRNTVRQGDFMAIVDLMDAYFSIPIFQGHLKFLRFRWKNNTFE
jgi:hypothetical protein